MRQERTVQATIFEVFAGHQIGCELRAISGWLDGQRAMISVVASDLCREGLRQTGRRGNGSALCVAQTAAATQL